MRSMVLAKRQEYAAAVDRFLKDTGLAMPAEAKARLELESMVYNAGPGTIAGWSMKSVTVVTKINMMGSTTVVVKRPMVFGPG